MLSFYPENSKEPYDRVEALFGPEFSPPKLLLDAGPCTIGGTTLIIVLVT
jgi:hypothetical protein